MVRGNKGAAKMLRWLGGLSVAAALVWSRGNGLAHLLGGRYLIKSFLYDLIGFCFLLLVLVLLSRAARYVSQLLFQRWKWAARLAYSLLMLIAALPMLLAAVQLHPQRVNGVGTRTPAEDGLAYQNVTFTADDLALAGWFIPADKPQQPIVLVTHGLNANKANFLYVARPLHEAGLNVFTFDFRAHGESEGRTITFGINEAHDVKAACDWLTQTHPAQPIYALGFSMGGAAVARAAGEYGIFERIALDSTFACFGNVVQATTLKPYGPLRPLLWQLGRGWAWLWTLRDFAGNQPAQSLAQWPGHHLLLIHGTADSVIPMVEAQLLHTATAPVSKLWLIENSEHVQSYQQPEYLSRLIRFFTGGRENPLPSAK